MSDVPLLQAKGVSKRYGGVRAVRDVSMLLAEGEILGLVGPNGAGKTTLVDLICGVQAADAGEIYVRGRRLSGPPSRRAHIGRLARTFQHPLLAHELTVRENILVGLTAHRLSGITGVVRSMFTGLFDSRISEAGQRVEEICENLRIRGLERECSELTLGEMRLVEVARALMQDPAALLLDEPFACSDAGGVHGLSQAISHILSMGTGVILVDHNVDIVASLVGRIVLMAEGSVVFDGPTRECLESGQMRAVYFGKRSMATS
jgi:branched-chain amino acid transport system ATP-binding protein